MSKGKMPSAVSKGPSRRPKQKGKIKRMLAEKEAKSFSVQQKIIGDKIDRYESERIKHYTAINNNPVLIKNMVDRDVKRYIKEIV